jgi:universal stress protein E
MNEKMRKILVAIRNPSNTPHAQLSKAAAVARASGASIELLHAITEPVICDGASHMERPSSVAHDDIAASRRLARMQRSPVFKDLSVSVAVVHAYPVHEAILHRARMIRADLVVVASEPRSAGDRLLLTNTDWELIRHCEMPLLLVKSARDYDKPVIVAAVDPYHTHAKPADLDLKLIDASAMFAQLLRGEAHVFHAAPPLTTAGPWIPGEIVELHQAQARSAFDDVAAKAGIAANRRHFTMGDVSSELCATIKELDARIVVMGAVSRSRLRRLLIGNTAERVLDQLMCDVLVLKPRGFEEVATKRSVTRNRRVA